MDLALMRIAAKLLRMAADEFSNHTCNDMDVSIFSDLTDDQKINLIGAYYAQNGDTEMIREFEQDSPQGKLKHFSWIGDSSWMDFFAKQLESGAVTLNFPVEVVPHFTISKATFRADTPEQMATAITTAKSTSPTGEVSLKFLK